MSHMDRIRGRLVQGMIMNPVSKYNMERDSKNIIWSADVLVSATEDLMKRVFEEYQVRVRVTITYTNGEFAGYWWGPNRVVSTPTTSSNPLTLLERLEKHIVSEIAYSVKAVVKTP